MNVEDLVSMLHHSSSAARIQTTFQTSFSAEREACGEDLWTGVLTIQDEFLKS